jgi:hypothetical protein
MFHVNLRLADEHSPRLVWGIASRSLPTERRWRNIPEPEMRIAEIIGDEPQSAAFRQQYHLPEVLPRERVGTIRVLCPTSAERDSRIATMPSPPR